MGIITDLLQSADKLNEDLALHDYVSFEVFFDIMGEFKHEVRQFQKPYDNQQAEQISLMV